MAEISPLRRRMIDDMMIRNLSPATQQSYLYAVAKFSQHFGRSPELSGLPTIARRARFGDPGPSEPRGHGPQGNMGELASSWLHPLRSWSLRETRGGSV